LSVVGPANSVFSQLNRLQFFLAIGLLFASTAHAQYEIDLFNLTDVSGDLSVRYVLNERADENPRGSTSSQSSRLLEELSVRTKSYVYHPAFINILASGGPIFTQRTDDYTTDSLRSSDTLFGYDILINVLPRKPYRFSVFFSQAHPEVSTNLTGSYTTKSDRFGVNGSLLKPLAPIDINWGVSRQQLIGEGLGASLDTLSDSANVFASIPYKRDQNLQVAFNWNETLSRSGSLGLPIQESLNEITILKVNADNQWGSDRRFSLDQEFTHNNTKTEAADFREVKSTRYIGNLKWDASSMARPYLSARYYETDRGFTWRRGQSATLGTSYRLRNQIRLSGNVDAGNSSSPDVSQDRKGLRLGASRTQAVRLGRLSISAGASIRHTNQTSLSESSQVFDEPLILVGSTRVALDERFVLENSVVVTNADRTQTFVEDLDYRLVTIGDETGIERIISGNIFDGQTVLVDYDFRTGGTVEYQNQSKSLSTSLFLSPRLSFFLTVASNSTEVVGGEPTTPLNDVTRFDFGGQFDYPILDGWSIGGDARLAKVDEEIAPYVKSTFSAYVQSDTYWRTRVRFGLNRDLIDYETSQEDVDRRGYVISVNSDLPAGIAVRYSAGFNEDAGGSKLKENLRHSLRLDWRYRLVSLSLAARIYESVQGDVKRKDKDVNLMVRRYF
jgi:hypothetical protein